MRERVPTFEEVDGHRGNRLMMMILTYGSTKDILSMNGYEVLRFIQEIESGRFSEMALDRNRRKEYRNFENHLLRYFHNFLAGAKTLIDHTRIMMSSELLSDEHRIAYQAQVDEIFDSDLAKFIGDFRNYALHCGLPQLSHVCAIPEEKWEVALHLRDLARWDGWTSRSRRFLENHPDEIRLSWLVASYQKLALTLHEWLVQSFMTFYKDVFDEFDELKAVFRDNIKGERDDTPHA